MLIDFSKYSSIKIGPVVDVKVINEPLDYDGEFIIGGAYNLLVSPMPKKIAILSDRFKYIKRDDNRLIVGAKTTTASLYRYTKENNIGGFEFLSKLPGTVGGAVKMNAGLKNYEIFNNILSLKTTNREHSKDTINYKYRYTDIDLPICEITFDINSEFNLELLNTFTQMRSNQPKEPSAGSCFKNPPNNFAGKLLEDVGMRGFRLGNIGFSDIHSNFLVNYKDASFEDAIASITIAQERVMKETGIFLALEIVIV
jgi:UDP-N-acetylmuramate dehydrogenase